jgi:hypothetical protein
MTTEAVHSTRATSINSADTNPNSRRSSIRWATGNLHAAASKAKSVVRTLSCRLAYALSQYEQVTPPPVIRAQDGTYPRHRIRRVIFFRQGIHSLPEPKNATDIFDINCLFGNFTANRVIFRER